MIQFIKDIRNIITLEFSQISSFIYFIIKRQKSKIRILSIFYQNFAWNNNKNTMFYNDNMGRLNNYPLK